MQIGALAAASGTTTKTLRFYEGAGLLPPAPRTPSGYRDYSPDTVARLDFIRRGRAGGLTLAQIRRILDIRDAGTAPCRHVHELLTARVAELDRQIADLTALRTAVATLRNAAATGDPSHCDPATVCEYL
jgi:DNA-binding transcriptional MerR regulator